MFAGSRLSLRSTGMTAESLWLSLPRRHDRPAEPVLQLHAILGRQHARRIVRLDVHAREQRLVQGSQIAGEFLQAGLVVHVVGARDPARLRDADQIYALVGVARLHAGLAVAA